MRKRITLAFLLLILLMGCGMLLKPVLLPAPLVRDTPRDLPWTLPDYRQATTSWRLAEDGRIHAQVQHFFLEGISPQMVAWFYRQLPVSTVDYQGVRHPLYHIFHPTEHGRVRVLEPATDGRPGMGVGALVEREEWFGPFDSRGAARLLEFSDTGMLAQPQVLGLSIGSVRHSFRPSGDGTIYRVDTVIGSTIPLLGPAINWYLRERVFHPAMLEQWLRHQVEEVASLQFFLPALYRQRGQGDHYVLEDKLQDSTKI